MFLTAPASLGELLAQKRTGNESVKVSHLQKEGINMISFLISRCVALRGHGQVFSQKGHLGFSLLPPTGCAVKDKHTTYIFKIKLLRLYIRTNVGYFSRLFVGVNKFPMSKNFINCKILNKYKILYSTRLTTLELKLLSFSIFFSFQCLVQVLHIQWALFKYHLISSKIAVKLKNLHSVFISCYTSKQRFLTLTISPSTQIPHVMVHNILPYTQRI